MAEEVHNPTYQLPRALAWSPLIGSICGLMFLLPITFTLPDIAALLAGLFRHLSPTSVDIE